MTVRRVLSTSLVLLTAAAGTVTPAAGQEPARRTCETPLAAGQAAVAGRITDTATKLPLQQASVQVEWEAGGRQRRLQAETDSTGTYLVCALPAGARVSVRAQFGRANERTPVSLVEGQTTRADMELDAPRSRVGGRVVEAGTSRGVAHAELRVEGSPVQAVSGSDGAFQLPDLPAGDYRLSTSHLGFGTRTDSVRVEYGAIMIYTVSLDPAAIALPPVTVDVRVVALEQNGFYERQERGPGTFLTRSMWDSRGILVPSDILRNLPGVRVGSGRFGNVVYDRSSCAFRYYLDGARVGATFQIDDIPAEWIEALEVYRGPAQVPGRFTMPTSTARANCGVIVIWTKRAL
jgi:hypothetical protein